MEKRVLQGFLWLLHCDVRNYEVDEQSRRKVFLRIKKRIRHRNQQDGTSV